MFPPTDWRSRDGNNHLWFTRQLIYPLHQSSSSYFCGGSPRYCEVWNCFKLMQAGSHKFTASNSCSDELIKTDVSQAKYSAVPL